MKHRFTVQRITRIAVVAALYAVLTIAIAPASFLALQLRFAEVLVLLCFYHADYCVALTIGCAVSNLFSPFAVIDVPFGTLATLLSVYCIYRCRKLWLASLFPVVFNGLIVGLELHFFYAAPLVLSMLSVAAGELIVVCILGVPCFTAMQKHALFGRVIHPNQQKLA